MQLELNIILFHINFSKKYLIFSTLCTNFLIADAVTNEKIYQKMYATDKITLEPELILEDSNDIHQTDEETESISEDLLPKKSADIYLKSYEKFVQWKQVQNIEESCISESTLLMYFKHLKGKRVEVETYLTI